MPLIARLIGWILRALIPYMFVATAAVVAYFTGILKSIFFWILIQFLTISERLVSWISDGTTLFDYITFDNLPSEFLSFVVYLKVPEAFGIITAAYAILILRKNILRY